MWFCFSLKVVSAPTFALGLVGDGVMDRVVPDRDKGANARGLDVGYSFCLYDAKLTIW